MASAKSASHEPCLRCFRNQAIRLSSPVTNKRYLSRLLGQLGRYLQHSNVSRCDGTATAVADLRFRNPWTSSCCNKRLAPIGPAKAARSVADLMRRWLPQSLERSIGQTAHPAAHFAHSPSTSTVGCLTLNPLVLAAPRTPRVTSPDVVSCTAPHLLQIIKTTASPSGWECSHTKYSDLDASRCMQPASCRNSSSR